MEARSEESFRESVKLFRLFRKKREELENNGEAGLDMFLYTRDQLCVWEDRLRELGVDVSGDKPRQIPPSAERYPRTQKQIAKMKMAIESALWQYHQWKIIALVGMHAFHTTPEDPEGAAFKAMWDVWESYLFAKTVTLATSKTTTAHKPVALGQMTGYVRSHINLNEVPRLRKALQEEGPGAPSERLEEKLPSAALLAWGERSADEPLRPVPGKRQTNLISRVENIIEKEVGREATLHPTSASGDSPDEEMTFKDREESLKRGTLIEHDFAQRGELTDQELEEFAVWESVSAMLPGDEYRVLDLTYRKGLSQREIAEREGITVDGVKKRKKRALERALEKLEKQERAIGQ